MQSLQPPEYQHPYPLPYGLTRSHVYESRVNQFHNQGDPTPRPIGSRPAYQEPRRVYSTKLAEKPTRRQATDEDANNLKTPEGYCLTHWDPTEEPFVVVGPVFDADSLGKWIYQWTVDMYDARSPMAEVSAEFWLLIIQLNGYIKIIKELWRTIPTRKDKANAESLIDSEVKKMNEVQSMLNACKQPMMRAQEYDGGLGKNSGFELVQTLFGRDGNMGDTERFVQGVRLCIADFKDFKQLIAADQ